MRTRIEEWVADLVGVGVLIPGSLTLMIVAILIVIRLAVGESRRHQLAPELLINNLVWLLAFGLAGGRVFYWSEHSSWSDLPKLLAFWEGGMSLYGGFLGVTIGVFAASCFGRRDWLATADCCAPALAVGLFIGRIGCFLNGCDFGVQTAVPWAVRYPIASPAYQLHAESGVIAAGATLSLPVHPTQLYEAIFGLVLLAVLRTPAARALSTGSKLFGWLGAYSLCRFGVEGLREHSSPLLFDIFTAGQFWSIAFFVVATAALLRLHVASWRALLPWEGGRPLAALPKAIRG